VVLFDPATDGDPAAHAAKAVALAQPLGAGERIDIDRADARELARLPGVGPTLAKRIVADRQNRGAFGGTSGLDRVSGIGPAMLAKLSPHLTFSGRAAEAINVESAVRVPINRADLSELQALPGIGASKARAIIAFRDSAGPFRQLAELEQVPGINATLVRRLAPLLDFP
jgi:competence ComEA-like helix-hairpin-helix protein